MQSVRSKIFIWLLRNRHLLKLKLKAEVVDENFSVTDFRENIDRVSLKMKLPKDIITEKIKINNCFSISWRRKTLTKTL